MVALNTEAEAPLRILHVLRAPLGGLFRHVVDLTREQIARGHAVGLITDSLTGGDTAARILEGLAPGLQLGLSRTPIHRNPHLSDIHALSHVLARVGATRPDVVHGHGSKGGVLARLPGFVPGYARAIRAYTPHGGSLNHRPGSIAHRLYMQVERQLQHRTDLLIFESGFIAARYGAFVGKPSRANRVIHNGIGGAEFEPITHHPDATDFLYVGELRFAKGIDTLLEAMAQLARTLPQVPTLTLVGSGPDLARLETQVATLGLSSAITFRSAMPAREAFRLGRTLVVPSRAESLPYVVLEAAGACVPMVATNVGGIPEIFGPFRRRLIHSDDVPALSSALRDAVSMPEDERMAGAQALAASVQSRFSIDSMVDAVLAAYRDALAARERRAAPQGRASIALSPR